MLVQTLGLLLLVAGQAWGQTIRIPLSPAAFLSALTGGGGSRPSSSNNNNNNDAADREAYLNEYYNSQWEQFYQAQAAYNQYTQSIQYQQLLAYLFGPNGPFAQNNNLNPTTPTTEAPVTTSTALPTTPITETSNAIPGTSTTPTTETPSTSTAVATTPDLSTTSDAVGSTTTTTTTSTTPDPLTSTAVAPQNTDTTVDAVNPGRIHTTPLPFHYVPNSPISPYDLHRISSNPIYVRGSAVASSSAQGLPLYIPYSGIYRRPPPAAYFAIGEQK